MEHIQHLREVQEGCLISEKDLEVLKTQKINGKTFLKLAEIGMAYLVDQQ